MNTVLLQTAVPSLTFGATPDCAAKQVYGILHNTQLKVARSLVLSLLFQLKITGI